jgi:hypothetical protein
VEFLSKKKLAVELSESFGEDFFQRLIEIF